MQYIVSKSQGLVPNTLEASSQILAGHRSERGRMGERMGERMG